MKLNIKTILITGLFLLLFSANLHAQEKYEYAVIKYTERRFMQISINGIEYKELKIEKSEVKGDGDVNAALKEIDKMTSEGWELFTVNNSYVGSPVNLYYFFYLRKKVK